MALLALVLLTLIALARSHVLPLGARGQATESYVNQGNRYDCRAFQSQAEAQAVLRADPRDPNRLDGDGNGIACENNRAPRDTVPVPR